MTAFVPDSHVARLPSIAVWTDAQAEQAFIEESEPAACFFNITVRSAKLFKLLSDGRRKNTGFVGPGQFIGLAVSGTYAFSAEALIDIGSQNEVAICDPIALEGAAGGLSISPILASERHNVADQHVALRLGGRHLPWKSSAREGRKEETCHMTF
jgi:hypothetical protein